MIRLGLGAEPHTQLLTRMADYLKDNGIKFDGKNLRVGRKLEFDGKAERFVKDPEADAMLTREYRKGFEIS